MTDSMVNPRSAARLLAVQALYQMAMNSDATAAWVITEFRHHRLGREIDGQLYGRADEALFIDIVDGVATRQAEVDATLIQYLSSGWSLPRLDKTLLQILRAGTYELMARVDVPTAVIINEYVDVAKAFFEASDAAFVNAVLDSAARNLRHESARV